MNVDQIYQLQRDDAFAEQFLSKEYSTFVAMPFSNTGGYPEARITNLLQKVHSKANELLTDNNDSTLQKKRRFAPLLRVDQMTSGAVVITEQITKGILESHFFFGDLTGCNFGVVLETGLALALKPNERVLLFTQDGLHSLHFDLKVTNIYYYKEEDLIHRLAEALLRAAKVFEKAADSYIRLLSSQLTPDAISLLNIYGRIWKGRPDTTSQPGIWEDSASDYSIRFQESVGMVAFHNAVRELSARRLFWTDYKANATSGSDKYAMHATKLGWRVIENIWNHDEQMRQPENAPTGPNY